MRLDSHFHLWRLARGDYGWLTPAAGALYRDFEPQDFEPMLRANGVGSAIVVQAAPTRSETAFLLDLADRYDWIAGVVGWADLAAVDAAEQIAALADQPRLVGLRPMLQDLGDPEWILRQEVRPGLDAMAARGLVFDALVRAPQLPAIAELAKRHPDLSIVLDHCGKPAIGRKPDHAWQDMISALASAANLTVKLSGLLTEAPPGSDAEALRPFVDHILETFGAERVLWGSDWPVLTNANSYAGWLDLTETLLAPVGARARGAIMGGTSARIYGLERREG